jgi:hypothetical protein
MLARCSHWPWRITLISRAEQWAAFASDMAEVMAIEYAIEFEKGEPDRDLDEMVTDYKRDRDRERMRAQYRKAMRKREAMIDEWLDNIGNVSIEHRVRQMVRNGGAGVIDFVEYRREMARKPKKRRKRDRLGIL